MVGAARAVGRAGGNREQLAGGVQGVDLVADEQFAGTRRQIDDVRGVERDGCAITIHMRRRVSGVHAGGDSGCGGLERQAGCQITGKPRGCRAGPGVCEEIGVQRADALDIGLCKDSFRHSTWGGDKLEEDGCGGMGAAR